RHRLDERVSEFAEGRDALLALDLLLRIERIDAGGELAARLFGLPARIGQGDSRRRAEAHLAAPLVPHEDEGPRRLSVRDDQIEPAAIRVTPDRRARNKARGEPVLKPRHLPPNPPTLI